MAKQLPHFPPQPSPQVTEASKRQQALSFLTNQRSQFAINILVNLVKDRTVDLGNYEDFVVLSVKMADRMMDELYGVPKEEEKK